MEKKKPIDNKQPELIIMIGIAASGKSYYVDKHYSKTHQVISETHIVEGMKLEGIELLEDFKHAIMAVSTRALMLKKLPIVVDEPNLLVESLFMWTNFAYQHNYKIKALVVDTPLDVCIDRLKNLLDNMDKNIVDLVNKQYEQLEELKTILNTKHQKIVDEISFITYNGGEK